MTGPARPSPKSLAFWLAATLIVVGDYLTKRIAEASLSLNVPRQVFGDWVRFTLSYNVGAAMNVSVGSWSRVVLSAVAVAMVGALYRMYRVADGRDAWQTLALGLVAGGALGNLLDRLRSARGVVDFIDLGSPAWRFWIFNIADFGVTAGAVLLAIVLWRRPAPRPEPVESPAADHP